MGGLTTLAAGVGLSVMLASLAKPGAWTVGLLVILIGVVLTPFGLFPGLTAWSSREPRRPDR